MLTFASSSLKFAVPAYGMPRLGLFSIGLQKLSSKEKQPNFFTKLALGSLSGGIAGLIGTPTEVRFS